MRRAGVNAPAGSLAWLILYQLRVSWRSFRALWLWWALGLLVGLDLLVSVVNVSALQALGRQLSGFSVTEGWPLLIAAGLSLLVFSLLLASAISGTLETLFERGDVDLLLSSPLPVRRVLASRLLGVTVGALPLYAAAGLLITLPALVGGIWRVLGIWPWLISLSLLATALGAALTLGLVRLLDVRRARTAASIVGAVSGGAAFLLSQAGNLSGNRQNALTRTLGDFAGGLDPAQLPFARTPLWWPARALWLDGWASAAVVALSVLAFALVSAGLSRIYAQGALAALTFKAPSKARAQSGPLRFAAGNRAALLKEWRLLLRDPLLLSRTLLQVVYLIPLGLVTLRGGGFSLWRLVGGVGIFVLGSLTLNLASITANAEDAPDLLLSSPSQLSRLRWLKLWAAVVPVLIIWALLAVLGLSLAPSVALLLGLCSVLGSALIVLWRPMELRRTDLMQRRQRGDWLASLLALAMQVGFLGALFGLLLPGTWKAAGSAALLFALLIPLGVALSAWRRSAQ